MRALLVCALSIVSLAVAGCGDSSNVELSGDGGGDGDGGGGAADAHVFDGDGGLAGCVAGPTQCSDCVDNDNDGTIDGFDAECTGAADDDEGSFATGIPGDNIDAVKQDCFFDGNSGAGDDKCDLHVCCLLDLTAFGGECPAHLKPQQFDANDCTIAADSQCVMSCAPVTPPGCDCFGCCTICNETGCFDILTNPAVAPDCDESKIDDPDACPVCNKIETCGTDCNNENCELCPGQTEADLPASCAGQQCQVDQTACPMGNECSAAEFCANGCCILRDIVQ